MIPGEDDDLKLPDEPTPKEPLNDEEQEVTDQDDGQADGDADASEVGEEQDQGDEEKGEVVAKRGSAQFAKLREERREERLRADRLERELQDLRRDREEARARASVESPEQLAARLALMSPEERIDYKLEQAEKRNSAILQQQQFTMSDQADRMEYQTKAATDPRYSKYAPEVEAKLAEARRTGGNPKREVVLKYILGEKLLANASKTEPQRKAAAASVKRQTTSPMNGKGDQVSAGRKTSSLAKRLENMQL
jgi:hypothetical protein